MVKKDSILNLVRKLQINYLRNYSCKAFIIINNAFKKTNHLNKLKPNTWISYLISYDFINIYYV